MKAMLVREYGGPEVFEAADIPKPELKPDHVLVRVAATSVNMVDTMMRQMGKEYPYTPELPALLGIDFAGTVEALGEGVTEYAVGDEVYGCAGGIGDLPGALAEYVMADIWLIAPKPKNLSMREAAALPLVGITAYEALQRVEIGRAQRILIHGGAGGVGHVAIQLARHFGADVYATGACDEQTALIAGLGATAINYKTASVAEYVYTHTEGVGFEVIFDTVGGTNLANSFEAATINAQIVSTVARMELDLSAAHYKGLSLHVVFMPIPMIHDVNREDYVLALNELTKIAEAGALKPILDDARFSLDEIDKAHAHRTSGQVRGKVVVDVCSS